MEWRTFSLPAFQFPCRGGAHRQVYMFMVEPGTHGRGLRILHQGAVWPVVCPLTSTNSNTGEKFELLSTSALSSWDSTVDVFWCTYLPIVSCSLLSLSRIRSMRLVLRKWHFILKLLTVLVMYYGPITSGWSFISSSDKIDAQYDWSCINTNNPFFEYSNGM